MSKNNLPIRLTDERWIHITEEHAELAGYLMDVLEAVADPERILPAMRASCCPHGHSRMARYWSSCIVNCWRMALSSQLSSHVALYR
jgi:hypothetical protein